MRLKHLLPALLLLSAGSAQGTIYHVRAGATGSNTGLDWTNAYTDIQSALSIVIPGDAVWVAAGQYKPTTTTDRTVSFVLRNGVSIYGGFAGTETSLSQRNIAANPTVLNGDIGAVGDNSDNTHTLVKAVNITTTIELDGFRIMNGQATSSNYGGGLRVTDCLGGHVVVRHCSLLNNYCYNYGGGIYLAAARLTLDSCEFNGNQTSSGGNGGAICDGNNNGGYSILTIRDCVFTNNVARLGACLYNSVQFQDLLIDRCIFTNNVSPISIISIDDFDTASMLNSYVIGNTIDDFSGNILFVDAFSSGSVFSMVNCTIANNYNLYSNTIQDEAVRLQDAFHVVHNCIIHGNTTYAGRQLNTAPTVTNSIVQGGHANGTNIIDLDPEFMAPYTGSPANFDATAFDYSLAYTSPGVNSGNNGEVPAGSTLDLVGSARIQGGVVDMGCYETSFSVSVDPVTDERAAWYFDATEQALRIPGAAAGPQGKVRIMDLSGRLRALLPGGGTIPVELPNGLYLATRVGFPTLRFVIAE